MIDHSDTRPLTDFQRNAKTSLARLKRTRRAQVLTVNGRAAAVIIDPVVYQQLMDLAEQAVLGESLKSALDDFRTGKGISLAEFDRRMEAKLGSAPGRRSA